MKLDEAMGAALHRCTRVIQWHAFGVGPPTVPATWSGGQWVLLDTYELRWEPYKIAVFPRTDLPGLT